MAHVQPSWLLPEVAQYERGTSVNILTKQAFQSVFFPHLPVSHSWNVNLRNTNINIYSIYIYIYIHAWVWFHKGLADYPKKNTCSSPKSRSQPCHLSSCIQSLVHAGLEGLVPGALRGQRKQPGWGKDFLLTGAFYVGNFREWSISSLSIIMPATPSNPSIPYI